MTGNPVECDCKFAWIYSDNYRSLFNGLSDEEDSPAALYIFPPDNENGAISGEDEGDDDDVGKPEDICVGQLKAPCGLVMSSGNRVLTIDNDDEEDDLEVADSVLIDILENSTQNLQTNLLEKQGEMSIEPPLLRTGSHFAWVEDNSDGLIPIFPSRNFVDCKVKPHEQLEKFFDDELIEHIINESRRFAIFLGKPNPQITSAELKVFIAILLVSGYNGRNLFANQHQLLILDLSHNLLTCLTPNLFDHTPWLWQLKLGGNLLHDTTNLMENLKPLDYLHKLDLSQNQLQTIWCNETSVNATPKSLKIFRYSNMGMNLTLADGLNYITRFQPEIHEGGKLNLTVINLSGNRLREFSLDWLVAADITCPFEINLEHNLIENVFASKNVFNTTDDCHREIKMTGNPVECDCKFAWIYSENYRSLFNGLRCVQTSKDLAQLERNEMCPWKPVMCPSTCNCYTQSEFLHIKCKGTQHIEQLPRPEQVGLKSSVLDISDNNFIVLPLNTTFGYGNVSQLNASYNKITNINLTQLPPNLTVLDLRNNRLKSLDDEFLRTYLNDSTKLEFLYLSENPWFCDCSAQQLLYTIRTHRARIPDADQLLCVNQQNVTLLTANLRELCSSPVNAAYYQLVNVIVISVASAIIILLCIIALFYKYKLEVKVWLYGHNILRFWINECQLDKHKKFDAFISYAHQDADFVNHTLLPQLEQSEPPFRVCTHERNWLAGAYIPEQIIESVEQSRRTIIVLSQHFIESDWARMEFRTAHQCSLNEGRARIIMIKYGEISDSELLDRELKAYLNMNTYLDWQDVRFWDKLRYAMPHKLGGEKNSDMLEVNGRMYVMGQVEMNRLRDESV
ncbi:protein toll-like [Bactrocera tryoni]|uniref:protein toll-like n=1 Tax=Bactrocera tryoni TaxID=59916 RepID=UPI001A97300C|nr:protein toll-like [Bactrocera tryoni]